MERLKCPQCSHEWTPRALAHDTSRGYLWICCPLCMRWQKRGEYTVVDHTCANCHFQQNDHCSRIVQELNMYTINVTVKPEFSCSLWKEYKSARGSIGPFFAMSDGRSVYQVIFDNYRQDKRYLSSHRYTKDEAEEMCDWLNSLWNEEKGDNNESS